MLERLRDLAARWRRQADTADKRNKEAYARRRDDIAERYGAESMSLKVCACDLEEILSGTEEIDARRSTA